MYQTLTVSITIWLKIYLIIYYLALFFINISYDFKKNNLFYKTFVLLYNPHIKKLKDMIMENMDLILLDKIHQHFKNFDEEFLKMKPCRIDAQTVIDKLKNNEKVLIVDIRTEGETSLIGYSIPESINIPLHTLFEEANIKKLLEYKEYLIVVSCHTGVRTVVATAFLHLLGIDNAKSLEGGIAQFADSVKP